MANPEYLAKLKDGVEGWNEWRWENRSTRPILRGADPLGADPNRANLGGADLCGADLRFADLYLANFRSADLSWADIGDANMDSTVLNGAALGGAILTRSRFGFASIGAVDLSGIKGIGAVRHFAYSTIGTDTLAMTLRGAGGRFTDEQLVFFVDAGVPYDLLDYLPGILEANPIQFYSCFMSYSTADEDFATRLNEDLNEAGVRTWKWDLDAIAGRDLRANIDRAIRHYDKLILVCSENSLTSGPVEREIERALQKEDRLKKEHAERAKEALQKGEQPPFKDTDVLVPIRIDDTIFKWQSQFTADVTKRYIPDFSGKTERRTSAYKAEVKKLIAALKPNAWPPNGVRLPE